MSWRSKLCFEKSDAGLTSIRKGKMIKTRRIRHWAGVRNRASGRTNQMLCQDWMLWESTWWWIERYVEGSNNAPKVLREFGWTNDMPNNLNLLSCTYHSYDLNWVSFRYNHANLIMGQLGLNQDWIGPIVWPIQWLIIRSGGDTAQTRRWYHPMSLC